MSLTARQEQFCIEFLIDFNATQAAIRAGYSKKTAKQIGSENLTKLDVQKRIKELRDSVNTPKIASAKERMEFLSQVMRGEVKDEIISKSPKGSTISKSIFIGDRIKAAIELDKMDKSVPKEDPKTKLDSLVNALLTRYDNEE